LVFLKNSFLFQKTGIDPSFSDIYQVNVNHIIEGFVDQDRLFTAEVFFSIILFFF